MTVPSIEFGDGRRPESATRVTLPAFDGPLALLLALIEARQLDVLTVPLGSLAGAYLEALATLDDDRMGNVSVFVAIASQLILIKSRAMLPRRAIGGAVPLADEGPDPEAELRARLILYRAFRDAGARLLDDARARVGLFHREATTARTAGLAGARPPAAAPLSTWTIRSAEPLAFVSATAPSVTVLRIAMYWLRYTCSRIRSARLCDHHVGPAPVRPGVQIICTTVFVPNTSSSVTPTLSTRSFVR
jgi:hypothetical protein